MLKTAQLVVITALILAFTAPALADSIGKEKKLGIGLGGGTSTSGLTFKYYLAPTTAVQAFAGVHGAWGTSVGADYILEMGDLISASSWRLYWGGGAGAGLLMYSVGNSQAAIIGVSGVLQLAFHLRRFPVEIVTDWRPTFWIGDFIGGLNLSGGGGALRWYF